jgi:hypothetical protein
MSYAIYWYEGTLGPRYAGRVELTDSSMKLCGSTFDHRLLESIAFDDIASVRLSAGRLLITRRGGAALELGSVDGPGSLRELADRLASALTLAAVLPFD